MTASPQDRVIMISPSEYLYQTHHYSHHVFTSLFLSQRMVLEINQEMVALGIGREYQNLLKVIPLVHINALAQDLSHSLSLKRQCLNSVKQLDWNNAPHSATTPILMKIKAWNCRGAQRQEFGTKARDLLFCHNPHIFILMETKLIAD